MSFMRAFQSLREVFPQVDGRILKAVAIEHYKDVDAAVEFILSEVLPFISGPPEALPSLHGTPEIKFPSADAELKDLGFVSSSGAEETALSFFPGSKSAACEHTPGAVSAVQISATLSDTSPSMDEAISSKFSGLRSVACDSAPGTDHASAAFPIKTHHLGEADASLFSETRPEACEIAPGSAFHGKSVYMEEPAGGAAELNNFPSRHEQVVKEPYASLQSESTLLATENAIVTEPAGGAAQLNNLTSSYEEAVKEQYASVPSELVFLATENALVSEPFHVKAPNLDDSFADDLSPVHSGNDSEIQSCFSAEEAMSREKHLLGSCQGSFAATSFVMTEDANVVWTSALHSNVREFCQLECNDIVSSVSTSCQQFTPPATEEITVSVEHGVSEENSTKSPGSQYEELEHGVAEENNTKSSSSKYEEEHSKSSAKKGDDEMDFDTETGVVDFSNNLATIATRSGQVVSIDFLEDFIADAKNNKKTLAAAMESVVCMMKEVELHEREATQAKEEASMAGLDVLAKVEDLKRMLSHANEANDMHAGEVYGEKSILATEARELQSRLLSLSDERDRSLLIINEMHQTLKARLAAADAERAAAEEEKMEKDKMAREALAEQEFIMNKVVQESKKLHQEAEENAKLREFLMDRGRIVDVLQGEIGVICEDVMSLKERVDGRVPLSKSLASSLTSRSLASSSSSSSHKSMLSYRVPDLLADSTEGASQEFPGNQQPEDDPKSRGKSVDAGNSDGKAASSSDDDWDLVVEEGDPTHLGDIMIE